MCHHWLFTWWQPSLLKGNDNHTFFQLIGDNADDARLHWRNVWGRHAAPFKRFVDFIFITRVGIWMNSRANIKPISKTHSPHLSKVPLEGMQVPDRLQLNFVLLNNSTIHCEKYRSNNRCRDLNSKPLEHESVILPQYQGQSYIQNFRRTLFCAWF